jgi:hypothetical protein
MRLEELGVATPEPIAYILCYESGLLSYSYLLTVQSDLTRSFYEFGHDGIVGREDILRNFAVFTAKLHEKGVWHKDYSPGNILFDKVDDVWNFAIVDINRMSFRPITVELGCTAFARLWGKPDLFQLIVEEYAKYRGADYRYCYDLTIRARDKFWKNRDHSFFDYE